MSVSESRLFGERWVTYDSDFLEVPAGRAQQFDEGSHEGVEVGEDLFLHALAEHCQSVVCLLLNPNP